MLVYASLPIAWAAAFWQPTLTLAAAALAAVFVLWRGGLHGRADWILGVGLGGLTMLLVKDFWPTTSPWLEQWSRQAGWGDARWWLAVRHPQIWVECQQAAALATAVLGISAVHAAWARGEVSRRQWLMLLGVMLLLWVLAVMIFTDPAQVYRPGNCLPGVESKNAAATIAALATLLSLGLGAAAWARGRRITAMLWLCGMALAGNTLLRLNSWTGVLGAVVGCTVLVPRIVRRHHFRSNRLWLVSGVAGLVLLVLVISPTLARRLPAFGHDYRFEIWQDTLRMVAQNPLGGFGLGSFEKVYPLFGHLEIAADSRVMHPDSSWVLLGLEWGWLPVGLLLVAGVAGAGRRRVRAGDDPCDTRSNRLTAATLVAALAAWLACGLTDPALHRPVTAVIGCSLLPFLFRPVSTETPRRWARPALAFALGLVVIGLAAGRYQTRTETDASHAAAALRADPLNARLHWQAAFQAWNAPDRPRAIRHFRAVATLEHRSMETAEAIARLLSPTEPGAALFFWQAAFERGRTDPNRSAGLLERVASDFPRLSAAYWEEAIPAKAPRLRVVLATRPDADSERLLRSWIRDGGPELLRTPADCELFYRALRRVPDGQSLVAAVIARQPTGAPRAFYLRAAKDFHAAGDDAAAWSVLLQVEPWRSVSAAAQPLVLDPRNIRWLGLLGATQDRSRERLLEEICAQSSVPPWFHLQYAQARRAVGEHREAVSHLLQFTPAEPPAD